jgi:hypothetical protein
MPTQSVNDPVNMPRVTASFSRPNQNTAYAAGDIIANSITASAVVPLTFRNIPTSGSLLGCSCVVTPASGNLIITALDFDLLLFRPTTSIPFAAAGYPADNTAMAITATSFRELVAVFRFAAGAWRNPAGALTAGVSGYQDVNINSSRVLGSYDDSEFSSNTLIGVVQCLAAWTPTGIVNQFDFALDIKP